MDNKTLLIMGATAGLMSLSNSTFVNPVYLNEDRMGTQSEGELYNAPVKYITEAERLSVRLNELSKLEDNWDGLGAIAPLYATIENSKLVIDNIREKYLKLLDLDDVVPSPYGTISLYFEDNNDNELSIELGKELIGVSGEIDSKEVILDDVPMHDFPMIIEIIDNLTISA